MKNIPFLDLSKQYKQIQKELNPVLKEAMKRYDFILGKDVTLFENNFATYCSRKFAVGVNSGTDALFLGLLSQGIGPGDEVIVPAFTYIATALAVSYTGAKPVFADIDEDTFNIDIQSVEKVITKNTKAIIPVHLYGQPADMEPILRIAQTYRLKVIEDTAQAHGAKYRVSTGAWRIAGSFGDLGCFSFYPTKNLGAFGDGGMIVTDDEAAYKKLLMLRDYGRKSRYEHIALGYNSRLDTLQAAILRVKLPYLDEWNEMRRSSAEQYSRKLKDIDSVVLPREAAYARHVYHIYGIRVKNRQALIEGLSKNGIGVLIHYPIPLHLQEVYKNLGYKQGDFPVSEKIAAEVLSLPMYPYLRKTQIDTIARVIKNILRS